VIEIVEESPVMPMNLTEEQVLLKEVAREFILEKAPTSLRRRLHDQESVIDCSLEVWEEMAALGWPGVIIPEAYGGLDFGFKGLGVLMEESGRTLAASPLLSTIVLGASAILLGGSEWQRQEFLPRISSGKCLLSLVVDEGPHHDPLGMTMQAVKKSGSYLLNGTKTFVMDGSIADFLVVAVRTSCQSQGLGGISLLIINSKSQGLTKGRLDMADGRGFAVVNFENVKVGQEALLGSEGQGGPLLDQVLDRGRIALAAEMLGSMQQAFDMILAYLKERRQFGQLIGTFQALQHRAAKMFSDIELSRSVVLEALTAVEEDRADIPVLASLAKATVNDAFHNISCEGIQMHGGMGMTDEHNIGFYLKRARVAEQLLGSSTFHRSRYAKLNGF
jgi:alkylation response protein AidB-like acyl-CoA dehydrogenase